MRRPPWSSRHRPPGHRARSWKAGPDRRRSRRSVPRCDAAPGSPSNRPRAGYPLQGAAARADRLSCRPVRSQSFRQRLATAVRKSPEGLMHERVPGDLYIVQPASPRGRAVDLAGTSARLRTTWRYGLGCPARYIDHRHRCHKAGHDSSSGGRSGESLALESKLAVRIALSAFEAWSPRKPIPCLANSPSLNQDLTAPTDAPAAADRIDIDAERSRRF